MPQTLAGCLAVSSHARILSTLPSADSFLSSAAVADLGAANAQACTIAQIESVEACKNIEAIAAVPGIDALFIGPSDLAASAGHLGNPKAPEVQQLIEDAIARIVAAGKPCGAFAFDPKVARRYFELGARFVAVGSDVTLLTRGASQLLAEFERAQ